MGRSLSLFVCLPIAIFLWGEMMNGKLIFITGGVRSGKSAFAEQYVSSLQYEKAYYVATGVAIDEEMKQRITRHQVDRASQSLNWETIESPTELPLLNGRPAIILFECVTTWLSNVLYMKYSEEVNECVKRFIEQLMHWRQDGHIVVVVSNEVLDEGPSPYSETELYRKLLGAVHQQIVANSDEAYEVSFGVVQRWK